MKKVIKAPAKINLCLKVNGKMADGYHNLDMIMQTISIYDTMEIEITKYGKFDFFTFINFPQYIKAPIWGFNKIDLDFLKLFAIKKDDLKEDKQVNLKCNFNYIPTDDRNLVVKIVKYLFEKYEIKDKIYIYLKKMIPTSAGLGGGSSDAAEILLFLNKYYKLNLSIDELVNIAVKFGSDIPFFLYKKECICKGRGEKITPIKPFNNYYVLIATPNVRVSTKDAYDAYDRIINDNQIKNDSEKFDTLLKCINEKKLYDMSKNLFNDLEIATQNIFSEVKVFKDRLLDYGAIASLMSGSGPTVFGIFNNYFKVKKCKDMLKKEYNDAFVFITRPI